MTTNKLILTNPKLLLGSVTDYGGGRITIPAFFINLLLLLSLMSLQVCAQNSTPPNQPSNGPKFNLKIAIVMILLLALFFILGFLSVYSRRCGRNLPLRGSGGHNTNPPLGGLDPSVIESFPSFVYSTVKGHKLGNDSLGCAVCLNEFQDDETLRLIPKCDHVFHPDCIDFWLISNSTCPVCRANLVPQPGDISPYSLVQLLNDDIESGLPDQSPIPQSKVGDNGSPGPKLNFNIDDAPENKAINIDQGRPPRSRSTGFRGPPRSRSSGWGLNGLFTRSVSTGHLLIRPGENVERFTLRLPEEVRSQLMNSAMNRTNSNSTTLPRIGSVRRGYRSRSVGTGRQNSNSTFQRFDRNMRSDRWTFSLMPPFVSRTGSVRNQREMGRDDVGKTVQSDHSSGRNNIGEQSRDPLKLENQG